MMPLASGCGKVAHALHVGPAESVFVGLAPLALRYGLGRVVILGEAAMLTAQVVSVPGKPARKAGMNAPGNDNRQFALNVMHWLSGVLPAE